MQVVENFKSNTNINSIWTTGSGKSTLAGKTNIVNKNNDLNIPKAQIYLRRSICIQLNKNFSNSVKQDCQTIYRKIIEEQQKIDDGDSTNTLISN